MDIEADLRSYLKRRDLTRHRLLARIALPALLAVAWSSAQSGTPAGKPSSRKPVLVGLATGAERLSHVWLVGAYRPGQGWIDDRRARSLLDSEARFTLYGLKGRLGEVAVGKAESGEEIGGYAAPVRRASSERSSISGILALAGTPHSPVPRLPRSQSLTHPLYQRAVASLLHTKGLSVARVRLTQHLRLDLNGDGVEEVLLCAHSRARMGREPEANRGDYALVALRFVTKDKTVRTVPLSMDVYPRAVQFGAPERYAVVACPDINGDGRLEIALQSSYYEGWGMHVFTFDGRAVRRVLSAGWGV